MCSLLYFFFNATATTEIYTLSLHDALPIAESVRRGACSPTKSRCCQKPTRPQRSRSEEHTSELQSRQYLVCRLLLEKKKNKQQAEQQRQQKPLQHIRQRARPRQVRTSQPEP